MLDMNRADPEQSVQCRDWKDELRIDIEKSLLLKDDEDDNTTEELVMYCVFDKLSVSLGIISSISRVAYVSIILIYVPNYKLFLKNDD